MNRPRLLLADDHVMIAEGLRRLLAGEFELVGVVEDGRSLVDTAKQLKPDVVVTDISMPGLNGIEAIRHLKRENPAIRVVVLTMHQTAAYARRALEAGSSAFVVKHAAPAELVMAIRAALKGKIFISPSMTAEVLTDIERAPNLAGEATAAVTCRQREILQLLTEGHSAKEIAAALAISARTVEFHKYQIMDLHGLRNSAELVHFAIKNGIVAV
ncbi:MAG: response regulator transcription factor [Mesorhizobium sp.]|nr:MAG: response regulator transcription factor [Mesorhizobium sp.]TIV68066.1 MAG: response regulator transcription factor [Mesorhizobium sp.]